VDNPQKAARKKSNSKKEAPGLDGMGTSATINFPAKRAVDQRLWSDNLSWRCMNGYEVEACNKNLANKNLKDPQNPFLGSPPRVWGRR
jgi:hypothetical protein